MITPDTRRDGPDGYGSFGVRTKIFLPNKDIGLYYRHMDVSKDKCDRIGPGSNAWITLTGANYEFTRQQVYSKRLFPCFEVVGAHDTQRPGQG